MSIEKYEVEEMIALPADDVLGVDECYVKIVELLPYGYGVKDTGGEYFEVSFDLKTLFPC